MDLAGDPIPGSWQHLNSTKYPLKCSSTSWYQFDYSALFSQQFADYIAVADPKNPSHNLTLGELVNLGWVHEVWLHIDGDHDPYTCTNGVKMNDLQIAEVLRSQQRYDMSGAPIPGSFDACAGNGCFASDDAQTVSAVGRSLAILYVNGTRGPGCAIHSLGHGFETARRTDRFPTCRRTSAISAISISTRGSAFRSTVGTAPRASPTPASTRPTGPPER